VSATNEGFFSGVKCQNRLYVCVCVFFFPAPNRPALLFTFLRYGDAAVTERLPLANPAALWLMSPKAEILDYEAIYGTFLHL
jgi:hypothetical protein